MQIIYLFMYFLSFSIFAVVQLLCVSVCRASVNKDVYITISTLDGEDHPIDWCFTAQQHTKSQVVSCCQGRELALVAEDGQRKRIYNYKMNNKY